MGSEQHNMEEDCGKTFFFPRKTESNRRYNGGGKRMSGKLQVFSWNVFVKPVLWMKNVTQNCLYMV